MKRTLTGLFCILFLLGCDTDDGGHRVVGELASDRIELSAEFAEPIVEILVAEGATVANGDILMRQDNSRAMARLAEIMAARSQAQARLDELIRGPRQERILAARASLEGAVQELDFRHNELARIDALHERGLSSADARDKARAALDGAQAEHKLRRAQLSEVLAGTTVEELAQAEHALQQADARVDAAQIDLHRHEIRAPSDGIVDSRIFELGERPQPGQIAIVMLGGEQVHARVYVPEQLRVRVTPGTGATIFIDGREQSVDGRVRWVSAESAFTPYYALTEHDRGRLSYLAKIDIVDDMARLPDGVPVNVKFHLD